MSDVCQHRVWRGEAWSARESVCGRPVKGDDLCGIHLRMKRDRAEKDAARLAAKAAGEVVVQRLARHGIEARAGIDGHVYAPTGAALADALDARYPA